MFDISCPYAYIASTQVEALAQRCCAQLEWRPVLLGALIKVPGLSSARVLMCLTRCFHVPYVACVTYCRPTRLSLLLRAPWQTPTQM